MANKASPCYATYSDIVDAISIYKVSDIVVDDASITGAEARKLAGELEDIEQQIISLRSKLKKESQFNRKMELTLR